MNGSTPLDSSACLLFYFNSYLPTFTRLVDKRMQDVRRCSRVTPTNPACKDNTAESINLHPPEILYVANLHVPLFAHRLLSHSTANLATLSLSPSIYLNLHLSRLEIRSIRVYPLRARGGKTTFATFSSSSFSFSCQIRF